MRTSEFELCLTMPEQNSAAVLSYSGCFSSDSVKLLVSAWPFDTSWAELYANSMICVESDNHKVIQGVYADENNSYPSNILNGFEEFLMRRSAILLGVKIVDVALEVARDQIINDMGESGRYCDSIGMVLDPEVLYFATNISE